MPKSDLKIYENTLTMAQMQSIRLACDLPLLESGMLKKALANSLVTLSAVTEDRTIGTLRIIGDGSFIFLLADVMVDPEFRRMGIASAMVMYALRCVEKMLPAGMTGTVSLFASKGREGLYKRLGFRALPHADMGAGMQTMVVGTGGR